MSAVTHIVPEFALLSAADVERAIASASFDAVSVAREIYALHDAGQTVCPSVPFLRFPDKPDARVIALPAYVGGRFEAAGLKWIASFPGNLKIDLPRASACIILNDLMTGRPIACMEGAQISAWRTAASAALAAVTLNGGLQQAESLAFVGCGVIARNIAMALAADGWSFRTVRCFDARPEAAREMAQWIDATLPALTYEGAAACENLRQATAASLVAFATTALQPYVAADDITNKEAIVLHVSLRDLGPDVILSATNIVDDLNSCFAEKTSLHLAELQSGVRSFVAGTLSDIDKGALARPASGLRIFSPFGLSALDIGFAKLVFDEAVRLNTATPIEGFV